MKKYILIEVCDREISEPSVFGTPEEAYNELCRRIAKTIGVTDDEVKRISKASTDGYVGGSSFYLQINIRGIAFYLSLCYNIKCIFMFRKGACSSEKK